ncbi:hypothetical protein [Kitasatospora sp. A2-31]|uniref:hypothetical protein n=1 Tax=Kitasatospora sp. A2-31 TaxID=2916414 RepID=UPI001EE94369|nr:hypothetical protein [Kitasatospora sp. A2-31]MCG6493419.1 hypothetical protein [Kitasatospora sp. A2-31]
MGLWSKLTGGQTATTPASRSAGEQARRSAEIRRIDAGTAAWLRAGGRGPRKGS